MGARYQGVSKFYGLLDTIYFKDNDRNPRRAMLDMIPQGAVRVLELCTGTGVNLALIAKHRPQARVVGVDLSAPMLADARDMLQADGLDQRVALYEMDATLTRFDTGSFDAVILSLVLHETGDQLAAKMLSEARRLLAPGGSCWCWNGKRREAPANGCPSPSSAPSSQRASRRS